MALPQELRNAVHETLAHPPKKRPKRPQKDKARPVLGPVDEEARKWALRAVEAGLFAPREPELRKLLRMGGHLDDATPDFLQRIQVEYERFIYDNPTYNIQHYSGRNRKEWVVLSDFDVEYIRETVRDCRERKASLDPICRQYNLRKNGTALYSILRDGLWGWLLDGADVI